MKMTMVDSADLHLVTKQHKRLSLLLLCFFWQFFFLPTSTVSLTTYYEHKTESTVNHTAKADIHRPVVKRNCLHARIFSK